MSRNPFAAFTDEMLAEREAAGWQRVSTAVAAVEPLVLERITRRVRHHLPQAAAIELVAADGGGGWWPQAVLLRDGTRLDCSSAPAAAALARAEDLTTLLLDFGEILSSETDPSPYLLALGQAKAAHPDRTP